MITRNFFFFLKAALKVLSVTCFLQRLSSSLYGCKESDLLVFLVGFWSQLSSIIGWGFCNIRNNQDQSKCYQPQPKAVADNTYFDLDHSRYHKNRIILKNCFKENNKKRIMLKKQINRPCSYFAVWAWHCSRKSCIARATYRSLTYLRAD